MLLQVREVGKKVRAHCPTCGEVAWHWWVEAADRARCSRCGGVHSARWLTLGGGDPGADQRPLPPPLHRRRVPDAVEQQWHDQVAAQGPEGAVPYRTDLPLRVGQLVDHPSFGLGQVRKLIPPATAEIHFQQGFKRLRCRT